MTEQGGTPLHRELSDSVLDDPDENPSVRRAASWTLSSWADLGVLGASWAIVVAIWARARHRRRLQAD